MPMAWQYILLIISMLSVLGVLFWGIGTMARGGQYNVRWSNTIMRWRVVLQAIALAIFVVSLLLGSGD
jgi:acyl-homoserine lactone acylase PvdQ